MFMQCDIISIFFNKYNVFSPKLIVDNQEKFRHIFFVKLENQKQQLVKSFTLNFQLYYLQKFLLLLLYNS